MKELRYKCEICRSKHGARYCHFLPKSIVCNECFTEYMQLFHGFKNRKARKVRPDPTGLTIFIEATPEMAYEYKELLEESQKKLIEHLIDSPFTLEDLLEDKERRDTNYKRIIEEKDNNGISQDP